MMNTKETPKIGLLNNTMQPWIKKVYAALEGDVISNPSCPKCGTVCDGVLDSCERIGGPKGFFICRNLNCEHEWKAS